MRIVESGRMAYGEALALQRRLAAAIAVGEEEETLLLLEHPPVYTIGRGGDPANVLDSRLRPERVDRGGDITWHGPGQVVGYPLINLGRRGRDLHRWIGFLEELLVGLLGEFGIGAYCRPGEPGVWTGGGKIGFIGVGVRRWVTMHGFSLNVCPDLSGFAAINPCGRPGCPVTAMDREMASPPTVQQVVRRLNSAFIPLLTKRLPATKLSRPDAPARSRQ